MIPEGGRYVLYAGTQPESALKCDFRAILPPGPEFELGKLQSR